MAKFLELLKRLREAAGMSQGELARKSGLKQPTLSNYEKGERAPTWEAVQRIAKALGVSVEEFLEDVQLEEEGEKPVVKKAKPKKGK